MTATRRNKVGASNQDQVRVCDVPVGMDAVAVGRAAVEAAFVVVHEAFAAAGSARWGDVSPDEAYVLDAVGEALVGMVAVNSERGAS